MSMASAGEKLQTAQPRRAGGRAADCRQQLRLRKGTEPGLDR